LRAPRPASRTNTGTGVISLVYVIYMAKVIALEAQIIGALIHPFFIDIRCFNEA
jgi:hypothetical protein